MVWWVLGWLLAALWIWRVTDAAIGMRSVVDVASPDWDRQPPGDAPRISIIVPARDEEEEIESALRSLLSIEWPNYEVIAVNDRSTDRTRELMEHVAREHDSTYRLRIIHIEDLPPGWLG